MASGQAVAGGRSPAPACAARRRQAARPARAVAAAPAAESAGSVERSPFAGEFGRELSVAVDAVRSACALCAKVQASIMQRDPDASSAVDTKADKSLVTTADYASQALISLALSEAFGDAVLLVAEEDSGALRSDAATLAAVVALVNDARAAAGLPPASPDAVVAAVDRGSRPSAPASAPGAAPRHVWVLDPVDGTLGFVRGDQYAVALALLVGGRVVVSALGCPNMPAHGASLLSTNPGDASVAYGFTPSAVSRLLAGARGAGGWVRGVLFFAQAGGGCWASPTDAAQARASAPSRVAVSDEADPAKTRMTEPVLKANSSQGFSAQVASALGMAASPLRIYSMVKYGAVARGDAHVFMKFPKAGYREKVWDHAAGVLVVQEAGGVVSDAGGAPLDFSRGRFVEGLDRGIIACSAHLHPRLLAAVAESWQSSML